MNDKETAIVGHHRKARMMLAGLPLFLGLGMWVEMSRVLPASSEMWGVLAVAFGLLASIGGAVWHYAKARQVARVGVRLAKDRAVRAGVTSRAAARPAEPAVASSDSRGVSLETVILMGGLVLMVFVSLFGAYQVVERHVAMLEQQQAERSTTTLP